ncbi:MAG: hypothetical protein IJ262_01420, partial [Clostridia bacterium]|nr:hypothetical protein [Clostridia bacterium]
LWLLNFPWGKCPKKLLAFLDKGGIVPSGRLGAAAPTLSAWQSQRLCLKNGDCKPYPLRENLKLQLSVSYQHKTHAVFPAAPSKRKIFVSVN